uniref:Granzyme B n=1 Tax=Sciurus vulgaris TaxID=55149 RepID=A0A8D2ARB9_SCIVU
MHLLLLLLAFFLPPKTKAGEIIGGHEAKPHSRPYMAYLRILDQGSQQRCGGFLIREDFVLTAAHCQGRLKTKAKLNPAVQTIKLPRSKDKVMSGKVCHVAGWGRMVPPKGRFSNTLQEVKMRVQKDRVCELEKVLSKYYNSTIEMCVGDPKEKCSSFQGDSGGPLVCNNVVQGIVSYGKSNGTPPRVYTKVSSFLRWIKETMKSHQ